MAYKFKSRATADLTMLDAPGKQILQILGKTPGEPGIVTVEQIPAAITALETAVVEDEKRRKALEEDIKNGNAKAGEALVKLNDELGAVSLRQRVKPLVDMFRASAQENKDVTWEH